MSKEDHPVSANSVERLMRANDEAAEKHRIAYGLDCYNHAIDKAIQAVNNCYKEEFGHLEISMCDEIISKLKELKK